ncbi:MAG TPA: sugar ABC transporter substrate-binding protein [Gaiellaceae bacterium]|nr:sugar ABC transporter substrate-binding protein [Gaiellaceae bacterium]
MRGRAWTLAAVVCAFAVTGAGCGGGDGEGERASGTIDFMVFGEPEELKAYREVIRTFKEEEPGITVKLIEASDRDDLLARLSTSFAGGTPPDLFLLNYRFYGQFASRGVLEPVQERLDESDTFSEGDFYEQALEAFRRDGELICLPQNISSLVVYYNRDLFRRARVPEPKAGWAWNDMVEKAIRLTTDEDEDGNIDRYGLGVEPSIIRLAPFVWSNGGELVDDEEQPTRLTLDTPEAQQAMQAFFDLRDKHLVIPSDQEREAEDEETRFLNGSLAMVLSSRRSTPSFRTITTFDWDIAPLPRHKRPAGILHSDAYCMTKASERKAAAWRFMEFALSAEGQRITARSGRTVPSLKEVAESSAFLDPAAKPASSRVFLDTIDVIRRVPNISTWPEIEDAAEGIIETGLYQGVSADAAARKLTADTKPMFARAK